MDVDVYRSRIVCGGCCGSAWLGYLYSILSSTVDIYKT